MAGAAKLGDWSNRKFDLACKELYNYYGVRTSEPCFPLAGETHGGPYIRRFTQTNWAQGYGVAVVYSNPPGVPRQRVTDPKRF